MNMTPYQRGFLKRASSVGAYFASGPAMRGMALNSPNSALWGGALAQSAAQAGNAAGRGTGIPAGVGVGSLTNMLVSRMAGKDPAERRHTIHEHTDKLEHEGYKANAHRYGKRLAGPTAGLYGVAGAGLGAYLQSHADRGIGGIGSFSSGEGVPVADLLAGGLAGGLGGAALGAGLGYLGGGAHGLYDKFVTNHTSEDSKHRAETFKAKHPYSTALPFGDVFGAGMSRGMKLED